MRPFPAVVDHLANTEPNRLWLKIPEYHNNDELTWRDITFLQLSRAVNTMAHWMDLHLGRAPEKSDRDQVVAYVGINDIRHAIIMIAALKTGQRVFSLSLSLSFFLSFLFSISCRLDLTRGKKNRPFFRPLATLSKATSIYSSPPRAPKSSTLRNSRTSHHPCLVRPRLYSPHKSLPFPRYYPTALPRNHIAHAYLLPSLMMKRS